MASISAIAFLTLPWKMLNAMTAGMATRRPMAVATSASEMPDITAPAPLAWLRARIGERLDDPEDGAEEADEGGVVAQRAEDPEVALELEAQLGFRAGHRLRDGVGAPRELGDAGGGDGGGRSAVPFEQTRGAGRVGGQQPLQHLAPERRAVAARPTEADRAFDHHGDGENRQGDEQPEDPLRAEQREAEDPLRQVHALSTSPAENAITI